MLVAACKHIENLEGWASDLLQWAIQGLCWLALEAGYHIVDTLRPAVCCPDRSGCAALRYAAAAALLAQNKTLIARVLAEVVIDVVVQARPSEQCSRQPDSQEVLLAVTIPNTCTPWAG